ncbi:MAG TPA: hypothetical protein VFU49_23250 [Ktedonobacteraceae bacterium]|nr:hypothetical protein [Ktedonobacteraceae bacterium]
MNCSQARAILAIYRELKHDPVNTKALDEHLASCDACRQVHTQQAFVGERMRSLHTIEPSSDAHTRLMQALATEHLNYLQQSPSASPPAPAFLTPYLRQAQDNVQTDPLVAFSTADTGPLSIIQVPRKRRQSRQMSHMAILGLAATFLMVLLMGGLTSLLLLANRGIPGPGNNSASVATFAQVAMARYTTTTTYTHIMSAAATKNAIYYTAYGDGQTGWMLQRLDTQTGRSIPLLTAASTSPLIVLGSSENWLIWLQIDAPQPTDNKHLSGSARSWTLRALPLNPALATTAAPMTLAKDTFDQSTAPGWVHTPIQGLWFTNDGLLIAMIDSKGNAHLMSYKLAANQVIDAQQLANTASGHIITSPTANSDSTSIYWSEEWLGNDETLHSNIWTQQTVTPPPHQGNWIPHTVISTYLFRADGASFHPNIVNNMLFLLSTNSTNASSADQSSAGATPTVTPTTTPIAPLQTNPAVIARVALPFYPQQADETIQGTLLTFTADGAATLPGPQNTSGPISALQAGSRFLLWQSATRGFEMYDVVAKSPVSIGAGTIPQDASFVVVNGNTAVWTDASGVNNQSTPASTTTTLSMFSWPIARGAVGA